jgi:predicted transposase/invertase (TIGR01784 family)
MSTVFFDDEITIPDLRYDLAFKAVFAQDTLRSRKALGGLISACIGRTVSVLSFAANEPAPAFAWDRQIRYDIACRLESGELVEVEMTLYPDPDEPFREEYFAAKLFVSQDIRGSQAEYRELKNIYQINILANGVRCKDEHLVHSFEFYDRKHDLSFDGQMHIITVELAKAEKLAQEKDVKDMGAAEAWAVFLRYHADKSKRPLVNEILKRKEDIAMAGESVLAFSKEELEYFHETSKLKYELDMQSMKAHARREGREEGLTEGREEEKRETALRLKAMGLSLTQVAEAVGLSREEAEKL